MPTDKEMKKQFKEKAGREPEKYYAVSVLKEEGFKRSKCTKCGKYFWSVNPGQKVCGDPACSGGFRFFDGRLAKDLDYISVWKEFAKLFTKLGYTPIDRYPVVARWRDDTDFVQASIYDFQPYVVSGEVKPPANPLVVPQFSLRFNDIDNVGITGAHFTGFVMIGQHAFMPPEKWDQKKYFSDIHTWLKKGLGLPNEEITFHEDAWAGGGNIGPCMEFFSRGLELGNQVYMTHAIKADGKLEELKLKVLDMGMGHERNAWFCKASSTSYDAVFPNVCKKLYSASGIKPDNELIKKFLPYASYLNVDEVDDVGKAWEAVAKKIGITVAELREKILPLAALYSIGEHTRSLLVALSDGALPSNVGGGYNLRVILRRALSFIEQYSWNIELPAIAEWHASYLKPIFPELSWHLSEVSEILEVEKEKFKSTRQKSRQLVESILNKKEKIDEKRLIELYDSNGISPELIKEEAKRLGRDVKVPDNFYAKVAELHAAVEQHTAAKQADEVSFGETKATLAGYFHDYTKSEFKARAAKIVKNYVLLNSTLFYPESGGQLHDIGTLNGKKVINVFKEGNVIVHVMENNPKFKEGDIVIGKIDIERRKQLTQHHTATHIVNAAARKVLGSHINQAGAKKTTEKAHLDITHFKSITEEELRRIEDVANQIVKYKIMIGSWFMHRRSAEKRYGMSIYQGGAVPGKRLRIVEIPGVDVECCGGTHLKDTGEVGKIKLIGAAKIQDGIVRLTFTAGKAAEHEEHAEADVLGKTARILGCRKSQLPGRAEELFTKWKTAVKKKKEIKETDAAELKSSEEFKGSDSEILAKVCSIFKTQPEHIAKTAERFLGELKGIKTSHNSHS